MVIENVVVHGFEQAVRAIHRLPVGESDSYSTYIESATGNTAPFEYFIGDNDFALMKRLAKNDSDYKDFRKYIVVYADITAPNWFWEWLAYENWVEPGKGEILDTDTETRTVMFTYDALASLYVRRNADQENFPEWIESLPYAEIIINKSDDIQADIDKAIEEAGN